MGTSGGGAFFASFAFFAPARAGAVTRKRDLARGKPPENPQKPPFRGVYPKRSRGEDEFPVAFGTVSVAIATGRGTTV